MATQQSAEYPAVQSMRGWRKAWCGSERVFRKRVGATFLYVVESVKNRRLSYRWSVRGAGFAFDGPAENVLEGQLEALAAVRARHAASGRASCQ